MNTICLVILLVVLSGCSLKEPVFREVAPKANRLYFPTVLAEEQIQPGLWSAVPERKPGVGIPYHLSDPRTLAPLRIGAVFNWDATISEAEKAEKAGIFYYPMVWGCTLNRDRVEAFAKHFPGSMWLLLNEPDLKEQANCTPEKAIPFVHDTMEFIKTADPKARFACCGEAFARHSWMDRFLALWQATYGQPIVLDAVHMHVYKDFHTTCEWGSCWDFAEWEYRFDWRRHFREPYLAWRSWQLTRPELQSLPVIISETATLTGAWWDGSAIRNCRAGRTEAERMATCVLTPFMTWSTTRPEIQSVIWFSLYVAPKGYSMAPSNLCDDKECAEKTPIWKEWEENVNRWLIVTGGSTPSWVRSVR